MKKTLKSAIRKALTRKNTLYPHWEEVKEIATRYNCTEWQVSNFHKELVQEGKINGNGVSYQWKKDDLEYHLGENPKLYFMALLDWGCYLVLKGGWYFSGGFVMLCFFCIKWVLKLSYDILVGLYSLLKNIFRYFSETKQGASES